MKRALIPRPVRYLSWLGNFFLLLSLSRCMVGPDYQEPQISMPAQFVENVEGEGCTDEELCRWWKQFNDPLLDSFIEEAASGNYDLLIAMEQIREARAQYKIQRSYLFPEIDLNATSIRSRFSQNVFASAVNAESIAGGNVTNASTGSAAFGPPVQNFFQVGFDALWELDFWGKFRRGKRAAYDQWEASHFSAQNVLIATVSEVAKNYVLIRSLQQQIVLENGKIASLEEQLDLSLVLMNAGLDNEIEVDALFASLESEKAILPVLETSLKQTIYALAILLGREPESLAEAFDELKEVPKGANKVPAGLPSDLLRRRPDVRAAERQLAAATEQIGVNVANLFPHISLTGDAYGYEGDRLNNWFKRPSRYWSIGPSINWDLIDFGRTRGQIAVANSLQRQALLSYEQTVIASLQDVEGALVAYFEEQKRNHHYAQQVVADLRSLELTEDLFNAGLADLSQVLHAESTFLAAKSSLIQSDQALTTDLIAVYKALGGNWQCTSTP
jgi:multidrug efflux system outer membrane protein